MIIDSHDVSHFSGYFEDVTSISLQSLNVSLLKTISVVLTRSVTKLDKTCQFAPVHLFLPHGGILTGFGAWSGRNRNSAEI